MHGLDDEFTEDGQKETQRKPTDDQDCRTHKYKHCKKLLTFPWKTEEKLYSSATNGAG